MRQTKKQTEKKQMNHPNLQRSMAKLLLKAAKTGKMDLTNSDLKELVLLLALEAGNDTDETIVQRGKLRLEALKTLAQINATETDTSTDSALLEILSKK